jgi:hypothetical protein
MRPETPSVQHAAEKVGSGTSGAEALAENDAFVAALEALRHPKSDFFRSLPKEASHLLAIL